MTELSSTQLTLQCSKCAAHLDPHWAFCPHCAAANAGEVHDAPVPRTHERYPLRYAFGGLFFGVVVAPVCIIVGTMLTITGIGIIVGIPLIILGVLAPLLGSVIGLNELKGKCPWCGTKIASIVNHTQDFACPACSQMIAIRNREMQKAA